MAAVVVPFPCESRGRPPWRVRKGKSPAKRLLKAPILLKADVSELDEGWSDGEIIKALNTNAPLVYLVRKQLVEDGFEAALSRKQRTTPATSRIFDGEKEPRLIALACSTPPKGYGRWTLRLLEKKVVELEIRFRQRQHNRADAKKTCSTPTSRGNGSFRARRTVRS